MKKQKMVIIVCDEDKFKDFLLVLANNVDKLDEDEKFETYYGLAKLAE